MQPGQQPRQGVIYGYRTLGDYGDTRNMYYFGRSKQTAAYELSTEGLADGVQVRQKKFMRQKCRRVGLNSPTRMILWGRSEDVDKDWDNMKMYLRGHRQESPHPVLTNELWVGDNFFTCADRGPNALGVWLRAVWDRMREADGEAGEDGGDEEDDDEQPEEEEQPPVDLQVEVFRGPNAPQELVNRLLLLRAQ